MFFSLNGKNATQKEKQKPIKNKKKAKKHKVNKTVGELKYTQVQWGQNSFLQSKFFKNATNPKGKTFEDMDQETKTIDCKTKLLKTKVAFHYS